MGLKSILGELRRRHVFRVAAWYAVAAWLVIQIATNTFPYLLLPDWTVRLVIVLCLIGFPIALALAWALEVTPEGLKVVDESVSAGPRSSTPPWRSTSMWLALAGGILLGAGALQAWRTFAPASEDVAATEEPAPAAVPARILAVLPFENLGGEQANAAFTAGIHDSLITRIAKIGGMTVISRTSVMAYEGARPNLKDVARALGVTHVVEGSVQRAGEQVRIQAQLIDAATDSHLWAETYDRTLAEGFATQNEIATAIAKELSIRLSDQERLALTDIPTRNAGAFEQYVLGHADLVRGWDRDDALRTISHFQAAAQLDPDFALAFAELAIARIELAGLDVRLLSRELPLAQKAYEQALALRPDMAEGLLARGAYQYLGIRDYAAAEPDLITAAGLLPNNYLAQSYLGYLRRRQGRWQEAAELLERATILEPRDPGVLQALGDVYNALRQRAPMERAVERARAANPGELWTQVVHARLKLYYEGDLYGYVSTLERLRAEQPDSQDILIDLKWAYRVQGRAHEAIELMESEPEEWFGMPGVRAGEIGDAFMQAGDPVSARPYLEESLQQLNAAPPELVTRWDFAADTLFSRGYLLADLGRPDEGAALMREALAAVPRSRDEVHWAYTAVPVMEMLGRIGDMRGALELARQLMDPPTIHTPWTIWYWGLAPLQANPEFRELMSRHGVDVTRDPRVLKISQQSSSSQSN